MAFIVDLVIVMDMVFTVGKPVAQGDVLKVLGNFGQSKKNRVHADITRFVSDRNVIEVAFHQKDILDKIVELIHQYTEN